MSALPTPKPSAQEAGESAADFTAADQLQFARDVVRSEGEQLLRLASRVDQRIVYAAELLRDCAGSIIVTGIGKAGIIGQKISATLASTGTRSHFLHSAEAIHGDLGKVQSDDIVIVLSHSGTTEEIVKLLPALTEQAATLIAITASCDSPLGREADVVLELGKTREACNLGLAPTTSTTAMAAIGDSLALLTSRLRGFSKDDFAKYHPGGNLGLKLSTVDQSMRPVSECRTASDRTPVREVLVMASKAGRRSGAVMLHDSTGMLSGIFTDSDLARLLERRREEALDGPIGDVMSHQITTIASGAMLTDAVTILAEKKISELPVVNTSGQAIGMIDITDIVSLMPQDETEAEPTVLPFASEA